MVRSEAEKSAVSDRAPQRRGRTIPKTPSDRKRAGRTQPLVTLTDSFTRHRRDCWLAEYGAPESREQYHRIVAEWKAGGRRLPRLPAQPAEAARPDQLKLVVLLRDYYRFAKQHHDYGECRSLVAVMRLMKKFFGRTPAAEFRPNKLRLLRDETVRGDATETPPRKPWACKYINQQVQRVRRIVRWAVAHELAPAAVHQALGTVEPLKRGRGEKTSVRL